MNKPIILIFSAGYLPGYRAGGPIRSIESIVNLLSDEFYFKIITYDHDLGIEEPYEGVISDTWCRVGKAEVYYASKLSLRLLALSSLINSVKFDIMYLNSFFSTDFTLKPLLLRYLKINTLNCNIILAPRGEFSIGALKQKWLKKNIYIRFARICGLYNHLIWQASSRFEKNDIITSFTKAKVSVALPITIAPDLVSGSNDLLHTSQHQKQVGVLDIVFLSRISPKKNLDGALSMLKGIQGDITFNIFGTAEDHDYWQECQKIFQTFDSNIKVNYHGSVEHSQVRKIFQKHHLFFFPTLGENFGHVIIEALLEGCPILLSDQTPWRDLEDKGIGWDLSLECPDKFRDILQRCVNMDNIEFSNLSLQTKTYALNIVNDPLSLEQNRNLFFSALLNNPSAASSGEYSQN
ncbi:MAG: glycosyltransferase family 4 protein [Desulfuromonadaceae bacterium]